VERGGGRGSRGKMREGGKEGRVREGRESRNAQIQSWLIAYWTKHQFHISSVSSEY